MKNLNDLVKRFSNVLNKKNLAKEAVIEAVNNYTPLSLSPENIFIKDTVIEILASPAVKNEIVFKEQLILQYLKERHGIYISRILYK